MIYCHLHFSNGYCGCDEDEYITEEKLEDYPIEKYFEESMYNYGFYKPDERFCDMNDEEAYEEYQNGCFEYSYWEEITKEEYEENGGC